VSDTTDALESLLRSEGWRLLSDTARREWQERERIGRRNALGDTDDKRALDKLRQITAAQDAIEWLLNLPREEITRLKRMDLAPEEAQVTRMTPAMFGMSRRGSL